MEIKTISFSANDQVLTKESGSDNFVSNAVSYVKAEFSLGTGWTRADYNTVNAVWHSVFATISTVLDANNSCMAPVEMLAYNCDVYVNLVGTVVEDDTVSYRLTTEKAKAFAVNKIAEIEGSETTEITPSQFEQFVNEVRAEAEAIDNYTYDSEAWAKGTRAGVPVASTDPTYHNNSKYYADQGAALEQEVTDLKSDLNNIDTAIKTGIYEMYSKSELILDKYYTSSGSITTSSNWDITPYIKFPVGYTLHYKGVTVTGSNPSSIWLDENQDFISYFKTATGDNIILPPANARYVAFSVSKSDSNTFSFYCDLDEHNSITLNANGFELIDGWTLGALNGNNVISSNKSIIKQVTRNKPSIIKLLNSTGYRFYISMFDSLGTTRLVDSGWLTDEIYTVKANVPFYIAASNSDGTNLSNAEISELEKSVVISNDIGNAGIKKNKTFSDRFSYRCVNHMGYAVEAPEDSIAGYKLSKQQGYEIVETDIHFTSDGVAVLLHDDTINRVARNLDGTTIGTTINIADITYAEALNYDFGIYKGAEWSCKIATFEEFIILCKKLNLYAYVEIKQGIGLDETKWNGLKAIVAEHEMDERITWISSSSMYIQNIRLWSPTERLGYVVSSSSINVEFCDLIVNSGFNDGFLDISYSYLTDTIVANAQDCGLAIEVWVVDDAEILNEIDPYVSGVGTDTLKTDEVFSAL